MSLIIYTNRNDIPSGVDLVDVNDSFFNAKTVLTDSKLVADIMMAMDRAVFVSNDIFIGRSLHLGGLNKSMLSTGTKTLLNIINYPDKCFNVVECGDNALYFIPCIDRGSILWEIPNTVYTGDEDCDIIHNSVRYTNFYDFLEVVGSDE